MQEHPVPQNITSYEFHLIGNMTVKQFFELAAGGGLALLAYTSNLPFFLKWPIIFISVIGGIAMAFVPLEERPLDKWFISYIKAIYNPTKFYWKKKRKVPELFSYIPSIHKENSSIPQETLSQIMPRKRNRARDYLQSLTPSEDANNDPLEQAFNQKANDLLGLFQVVKPVESVTISTPQSSKDQSWMIGTKPNLKAAAPHALSAELFSPKIITQEGAAAPKPPSPTPQIKGEVLVPQSTPVHVESLTTQPASQPTSLIDLSIQPAAIPTATITRPQQLQERTISEAKTNTNLPFPKKPEKPNMVVGMVIDYSGNIVDGAIVEIKKPDGTPVRALKSNALGQFFVSTPLQTGTYQIEVEKDGYHFEPGSLLIQNTIVDPLEIRAKA